MKLQFLFYQEPVFRFELKNMIFFFPSEQIHNRRFEWFQEGMGVKGLYRSGKMYFWYLKKQASHFRLSP